MKKAGKVEYKLGLEPLHKNPDRIYSPSVIGAIVNKQNVHWVAIRFIEGKLFLLDSQRGRPIMMSERDYRYFVKKHEYAYCLELADDMSLPSGAVESGSTAAPPNGSRLPAAGVGVCRGELLHSRFPGVLGGSPRVVVVPVLRLSRLWKRRARRPQRSCWGPQKQAAGRERRQRSRSRRCAS